MLENPERRSIRQTINGEADGRLTDKSQKSRGLTFEGRSTDVTSRATGTFGDYSKKSAMEIAFGKIKGIMEELKDTNSPAAK